MVNKDVYSLYSKRAVITGASKGIGEHIAYSLARQGADIFLIARNEKKLKNVYQNIINIGRKCDYMSADLSSTACLTEIENRVRKFGGVDCYINNAAFTLFETPMNTSEKSIEELFNTNYRASVLLTKAMAGMMIDDHKKGTITFITSINAFSALPGQAVYSSTKAALESMMKSFAAELAPYGIRVNTIAPGAIITDMNSHFTAQVLSQLNEKIPIGRVGNPEDIGDVAAFICSDAARYITGSSIVVDGGYLLRK